MVQTTDPCPDFSWLSAAEVTADQFAVESVAMVSCLGLVHGNSEDLSQRQLCRRYLQQLACLIVEKKLSLQQCEAMLSASNFPGMGALHSAATDHRAAIRSLLLQRALAPLPGLLDFDWNVKLAVSSSRVAGLQEPLLGLVLHTTSPPDGAEDIRSSSVLSPALPGAVDVSAPSAAGGVMAELSLQQVEELIVSLKAAHLKMMKCA